MTPHSPDLVTRQDTAGRWLATCLTCHEQARPSTHKPLIEQWKRDHVTAATTITRRTA